MAEQNTPDYPPMMELERELTRKERQIEYLQTELRRYHNLMEELKQGMRPIGTVEDVRGDTALVKLSGGQAFQVSIPPEMKEKVTTEVDAVLSPTKGVIVDVIERLKDRAILEYQVEKSPKIFYDDIVGLVKEVFKLARDSAPSILFIDEADAIGRARMEATTDAGRDVQGMLNQILTELGEGFHVNRNVAVIFATNFPSVIDPALLDRVKRVIYVPPPRTKEAVKSLVDSYVSKVELDPSITDYAGGIAKEAFDEIWNIIRNRRQTYEATMPERGINVRDQYVITPRDVKNLVQEAASEASFVGEPFVTQDRLVTLFKSLCADERSSRLVS